MKNAVIIMTLVGCLCGTVFSAFFTETYIFDTAQSTLTQPPGCFTPIIHHPIEGQFQLTVNFDTGTASFDQIDATYGDMHYDLGYLFNINELIGTVINDTQIHFDGFLPNPSNPTTGNDIDIDLTFGNGYNTVYLTGFWEPDPTIITATEPMELNAVATVPEPITVLFFSMGAFWLHCKKRSSNKS